MYLYQYCYCVLINKLFITRNKLHKRTEEFNDSHDIMITNINPITHLITSIGIYPITSGNMLNTLTVSTYVDIVCLLVVLYRNSCDPAGDEDASDGVMMRGNIIIWSTVQRTPFLHPSTSDCSNKTIVLTNHTNLH